MPSVCPRCRTPMPVPTPPQCENCGEFLTAVEIKRPLPLPAQPGRQGTLTGPRLAGRLADGKFGEFALGLKTSLGRHPANTLRLIDREVSKEHASIEQLGSAFMLKDLGSSNGTFVNG